MKQMGAIAGERKGALLETTVIPDEKLIGLFATANDGNAFEEIVNRYGIKTGGWHLELRTTITAQKRFVRRYFLPLQRSRHIPGRVKNSQAGYVM